jgi:hypothetical protein
MVEDEITFTTTKRGKRAVIINGYQYTCQRESVQEKNSQWVCTDRSCKGRLHLTSDEKTWKLVQKHNHVADFGEAAASKVSSDIKIAAEASRHVEPTILTQKAVGEADEETLLRLPKEKSLKRTIQRVRRKNYPTNPKTLEDLQEIALVNIK